MIFNCRICNKPTQLTRPENKPLPIDMQICWECEMKKERKEIKTNLGYSRIGLKNV